MQTVQTMVQDVQKNNKNGYHCQNTSRIPKWYSQSPQHQHGDKWKRSAQKINNFFLHYLYSFCVSNCNTITRDSFVVA